MPFAAALFVSVFKAGRRECTHSQEYVLGAGCFSNTRWDHLRRTCPRRFHLVQQNVPDRSPNNRLLKYATTVTSTVVSFRVRVGAKRG